MTHTKDEALKLALEALEESETNNDTMEFWDRKTKAITAIKQALTAQPAPVQPMAHIVGEIDHTGKVWKPVQPAPVQPVALHAMAKRRVFDAIRGAYDLGYNDARGARAVHGDSAPGYKGRDVEADHGGALISALERYTAPPAAQAAHISPKQLLALAQEANLGLDKVIEVFRIAAPVQEPIGYAVPTFDFDNSVIKKVHYAGTVPLYTTPPAAQPAPTVQEPEIDGATMAGMDASIGHLSALVDELRLLLGCAMDNFKMLHNAAKPDDGPDMDAIIPAIVFAKFVNQDAALRYAIKHSAHDGMITTPPAAQPAVPDAITDDSESPEYRTGWNDCRAAMLDMLK
jgi:hypothetical protein